MLTTFSRGIRVKGFLKLSYELVFDPKMSMSFAVSLQYRSTTWLFASLGFINDDSYIIYVTGAATEGGEVGS